MFISNAVLAVLESDMASGLVLADWLQDHRPSHPELKTYVKRLSKPIELRFETLIGLMTKFGEKWERKFAARIKRLLLKLRNTRVRATMFDGFPDFTSLRSRKSINFLLSNNRTEGRCHKATYLKTIRICKPNFKTTEGNAEPSGYFLIQVFKDALATVIGTRTDSRAKAKAEVET